jgi:methionine salvage enolase-phosphatase E1
MRKAGRPTTQTAASIKLSTGLYGQAYFPLAPEKLLNTSPALFDISMTISLSAQNIRGLLLDIEGTTTPIAFVYDVLFPFARAHARDFLLRHLASDEVRLDVERLCQENAKDVAEQLSPPPLVDSSDLNAIVGYVHWLMDRDRKSTGLKSLQGKIWEEGYRSGALKSEVFPDVPVALERWHNAGLKVAIFSSGQRVGTAASVFAYRRRESDETDRRLFRHHHWAENRRGKLSANLFCAATQTGTDSVHHRHNRRIRISEQRRHAKRTVSSPGQPAAAKGGQAAHDSHL